MAAVSFRRAALKEPNSNCWLAVTIAASRTGRRRSVRFRPLTRRLLWVASIEPAIGERLPTRRLHRQRYT